MLGLLVTSSLISSKLCSRGCPPNSCSGASRPGPYDDRIHAGRSSIKSILIRSFVILYGFEPSLLSRLSLLLPPLLPPPPELRALKRLLLCPPNELELAPGCSNRQFAVSAFILASFSGSAWSEISSACRWPYVWRNSEVTGFKESNGAYLHFDNCLAGRIYRVEPYRCLRSLPKQVELDWHRQS